MENNEEQMELPNIESDDLYDNGHEYNKIKEDDSIILIQCKLGFRDYPLSRWFGYRDGIFYNRDSFRKTGSFSATFINQKEKSPSSICIFKYVSSLIVYLSVMLC